MARSFSFWYGPVRLGNVWQGEVRLGIIFMFKATQSMVRRSEARHGNAESLMSRLGGATFGSVRRCMVRQGSARF